MKKYFITSLLLLSFCLLPLLTFATYTPASLDPANVANVYIGNATGLGQRNPIDAIALTINWILTLLGIFFLVLMIYGGFTWMLAQGNESNIDKAKDIIKAAVIGLVIILASYGVSAFIFTVMVNISQS